MVHWDDPEGWSGEGGGTREGMMDRWMDDGQIDTFKFKILKGLVSATVPQIFSKLRQGTQEYYTLTLSCSLSSEQ